MKALRLTAARSLEIGDVPEPAPPHPHQAIVRITHVALNHLDLYGYRGMAFARRTLPLTVGVEAAGIVDRLGADAAHLREGDAVVIYPSPTCGTCDPCRCGQDTLCRRSRRIMGFHTHGMAAERVLVESRQLLAVPHGVDLVQAACAPITLATVRHMLIDNAKLRRGESVLVHAAGSGIGSVAVKMARAVGATVIATVGSDWKAEKARAIGADHVINYNREPFHSIARRLTDKRGVDVVFEHTGSVTWERSLLCLADGGRLVTCGSTSGVNAQTNLLHLVNHQLTILASFGGTRANVVQSLECLAAGEMEPVIDSVVEVEDMGTVLDRMERREVFGKILMRGFGAAPRTQAAE